MPASESYAIVHTDLVDSTRLNATLGDARMAEVWGSHDRATPDLVHRWNGLEIERTDGFLLLFHAADDAAMFALAYHRALARLSLPLTARVGMHIGPIDVHENPQGDVFHGAQRH